MFFTEEQQKVIEAVDGHIAVIACPGSGKTTTMLGRIDHMVRDCGIDPSRILMVTFTKSAADHMKERYKEINPECAASVWFGTIHSICYSIIRDEYGIGQGNLIARWEQIKFFKGLLSDVDKEVKEESAKKVMSAISAAVNTGKNPEKELDGVSLTLGGTGYQVLPFYTQYILYKKEHNKIDFDDMLTLARKVLKKSPLTLHKYQSMYDYIQIDEFQDTNRVQAEILYMLAEKHGNLCIVGDDDQSIYRFRSADPYLMLNFKKSFPDAQMFYLSSNYRSGAKIIRYAGELIGKNKDRYKKNFNAALDHNGELFLARYDSGTDENEAVLNWIQEKHDIGLPYNQMAVLYRVNREAAGLLPLFKDADIPVSIRENPDNIHNHFLFDIIASYWQLAKTYAETDDKGEGYFMKTSSMGLPVDEDGQLQPRMAECLKKILNCPQRYLKTSYFEKCTLTDKSIGKCVDAYMEDNPPKNGKGWDRKEDKLKETLYSLRRMLFRLSKYLDQPGRFLDTICTTPEFDDWLKGQAKFREASLDSLETTLESIMAEGESFDSMDKWMDYVGDYDAFLQSCGRNPDGVTLSTYHSAKGLEWDKVWLKNTSADVTPSPIKDDNAKPEEIEADIEEERRMFYVALTRARNEVQISYVSRMSPFIKDMAPGIQKTVYDIQAFQSGRPYSFRKLNLL